MLERLSNLYVQEGRVHLICFFHPRSSRTWKAFIGLLELVLGFLPQGCGGECCLGWQVSTAHGSFSLDALGARGLVMHRLFAGTGTVRESDTASHCLLCSPTCCFLLSPFTAGVRCSTDTKWMEPGPFLLFGNLSLGYSSLMYGSVRKDLLPF